MGTQRLCSLQNFSNEIIDKGSVHVIRIIHEREDGCLAEPADDHP
jgi:hypothetical protein